MSRVQGKYNFFQNERDSYLTTHTHIHAWVSVTHVCVCMYECLLLRYWQTNFPVTNNFKSHHFRGTAIDSNQTIAAAEAAATKRNMTIYVYVDNPNML